MGEAKRRRHFAEVHGAPVPAVAPDEHPKLAVAPFLEAAPAGGDRRAVACAECDAGLSTLGRMPAGVRILCSRCLLAVVCREADPPVPAAGIEDLLRAYDEARAALSPAEFNAMTGAMLGKMLPGMRVTEETARQHPWPRPSS